jgi:hypothetical protein
MPEVSDPVILHQPNLDSLIEKRLEVTELDEDSDVDVN